MKILIVTYYWPPSGGAGVLRWLSLAKYLVENKVEVHVLTVNPEVASYPVRDEKLLEDVHPGIKVHFTRSFEPVSLYAKLAGKKNVPTAGFSNVNTQSRLQRLVTWLRSNLFHPDPRIGWKRYALKQALLLRQSHQFDAVITTSPPHSVQLIGRDLKRKAPELRWIADFRDPWTDIYYYELLKKSGWAKKIDKQLERSVLKEADHILTISEGFRDGFLRNVPELGADKISILPNGYDPVDFEGAVSGSSDTFSIVYTGTIAKSYDPFSLIDVLGALQQEQPDRNIVLAFTGILDPAIREYLEEKGVTYAAHPPVAHREITKIQRAANVLLLVSPAMKTGDFIIPGKAFEYLAAGPPILGLAEADSETTKLLRYTQRGKAFPREDRAGIRRFLEGCLDGTTAYTGNGKVSEFSREAQAKRIKKIVQQLK